MHATTAHKNGITMIQFIFDKNNAKELGTIKTTALKPLSWKSCMELYMKTQVAARHTCLLQYAAVTVSTLIDNIVLCWCPCMTCINRVLYLISLRTHNLSSQDIITLEVEENFKDLMAIVPSPYNSKAKGEISVKQYLEMYKKADAALKEPKQ